VRLLTGDGRHSDSFETGQDVVVRFECDGIADGQASSSRVELRSSDGVLVHSCVSPTITNAPAGTAVASCHTLILESLPLLAGRYELSVSEPEAFGRSDRSAPVHCLQFDVRSSSAAGGMVAIKSRWLVESQGLVGAALTAAIAPRGRSH